MLWKRIILKSFDYLILDILNFRDDKLIKLIINLILIFKLKKWYQNQDVFIFNKIDIAA